MTLTNDRRRSLYLRYAISPDWPGFLHAALAPVPVTLRPARLLTLATVGLALSVGPRQPDRVPPRPRDAARLAAPAVVMVRVQMTPEATPELFHALCGLPRPVRRETFLAWAHAGCARLQPLAPAMGVTAGAPRATREGSPAPRPPRPAPPRPRSQPTATPPPPAADPPSPVPPPAAGAMAVTPPPDKLRRLVRNMGLGV